MEICLKLRCACSTSTRLLWNLCDRFLPIGGQRFCKCHRWRKKGYLNSGLLWKNFTRQWSAPANSWRRDGSSSAFGCGVISLSTSCRLVSIITSILFNWSKNLKNVSIQVFREDPRVKTRIAEMERQVEQGVITAGQAAEVLLHYFVPGTKVMP